MHAGMSSGILNPPKYGQWSRTEERTIDLTIRFRHAMGRNESGHAPVDNGDGTMSTRGDIILPSTGNDCLIAVPIKGDADPAYMKPNLQGKSEQDVLNIATGRMGRELTDREIGFANHLDGAKWFSKENLENPRDSRFYQFDEFVWYFDRAKGDWYYVDDNGMYRGELDKVLDAVMAAHDIRESAGEADSGDANLKRINEIENSIRVHMSRLGEEDGPNIGDIAEIVAKKGFAGMTRREANLLFSFMHGAREAGRLWHDNLDLIRDYFDAALAR